MGEFLLGVRNFLGLAWWVEVRSALPACTYYFGPFSDRAAALAEQAGYVEDLEFEGACGISVTVKRCRPGALTVVGDEFEREQLDRLGTALRRNKG